MGGRPLGFSSCTFVLPSLNNRHHFLTFPLFIAPSSHTSTIRLRISARRTFLVFRNRISDHTSQVAGFSILVFVLDYSELCVGGDGGDGGGGNMTPYYAVQALHLSYSRLHLIASAGITCTSALLFPLLSGRAA